MKKLSILVLIFFVSCTYKRKGEIIKTQDGKIYILEEAPGNEAYFFREIDTSAIKWLSK